MDDRAIASEQLLTEQHVASGAVAPLLVLGDVPVGADDQSQWSGQRIDEDGQLYEHLGQLAQAVGVARDLHAVFHAVRDFAIVTTPSNGLFASLYDATAQQRICVYAWSEGEDIDVATLPPMPMSNSPHSRAVATGQVIVTDDLQASLAGQPRVDLRFDVDPRLPRSAIAVPMAVMGRVIGGFEVQSADLAAYCDRHVVALRLAAHLAATAIENVQLIERERQLRLMAEASERRFRGLVSNASDLILVLNPAGGIQYASPSVQRLLDRPTSALVEQRLAAYLHPRDLYIMENALERVIEAGAASVTVELRIRNDAGHWRYVEAILTNLLHDPSLAGIVVNARDITERRQGEEALRFLTRASSVLASSFDYMATLDQVAQLVVPELADWCLIDMLDTDGTLQQVAVTHMDPVKVEVARELRRRFPPDPKSAHPIWNVLRSGQAELIPEISDLQVVAEDGEAQQILRALGTASYIIVPLQARGETLGAISFVSGTTRHGYGVADLAIAEEFARRAAQAIDNARLYREAQAAIQARDDFLSIASHELKSPLTALIAHAEALQRRAARQQSLSERDQRALGVILAQAVRLNSQIMTLLDVSRLQGGQLTIDPRPMDVCQLVRRVVEEVEPTLQRHSLEVTYREAPLVVAGDELRLEQVLLNLLQNAIKYSPAGGPILLQVEQADGFACLRITDQGIGIPQAAQPYLFERFYRSTNVAQQHITGLGIGLYVVKELVTRHGGDIEVTSREEQGSTFTVRLPLLTLRSPTT